MPNNKEFGKLTHEQFSKVVSCLPELRGQMKELADRMRTKQEKLKELIGDSDYSWGDIYELPFLEQMALLFITLGLHVPLYEVVTSTDPQEAACNWNDDGSALDVWFEAHEKTLEWKHLVWLTIVLQRNILAIMIYGQTLGALVEQVRQGSDEALFHAVRVDRSVLLAQPCADRLSKAELINDKLFFSHLRRALKGTDKKHMVALHDLKYAIVLLRECGFDRFSDQDIERLFISTRLYPNNAGALKNLRKHIQAARKLQPPKTSISGGRQPPS